MRLGKVRPFLSRLSSDNLSMLSTTIAAHRRNRSSRRPSGIHETPEQGGLPSAFAAVACRGAMIACLVGIAGCGSTSSGSGMLDQSLQTVGLQKLQPEAPSLEAASEALQRNPGSLQRKITLRLHAGDVLNTDADGRSLSIVARIYKLRDKVSFEAAPYADFQESKPSRAPDFAADIVAMKEVVLTPGKQYDVIETVGIDAPYFAVVALFRAPAPQRWRFVFDSKAASRTGVTLGVHACALSVSAGLALDVAPETVRVAGVKCPQT